MWLVEEKGMGDVFLMEIRLFGLGEEGW